MNVSRNSTRFHHSKTEMAVGATLLTIIMLSAFLGNLLTSMIFLRKPHLRTTTNISILFLSISDILMAVLVMPFSLASLVKGKWISTQEACTFNAWLLYSLIGVSLITMTSTAVIRFFCVVKPILHHQYIKPKIVAVGISILWLTTSFMFGGLALLATSDRRGYSKKRTFCFLAIRGNIAKVLNYIGLSLVVIAGLLIFLAYFKVFRFVSRHNQTMASNLQQGNPSHIEEARITKTLVIVVLGFVSCWAPATIIQVIDIFPRFRMPAFASLIQAVSIFAISCINPFIYGFTNRRLRREYLELLRFMLPLGVRVAPVGGS